MLRELGLFLLVNNPEAWEQPRMYGTPIYPDPSIYTVQRVFRIVFRPLYIRFLNSSTSLRLRDSLRSRIKDEKFLFVCAKSRRCDNLQAFDLTQYVRKIHEY